jgi:hypothetical protein
MEKDNKKTINLNLSSRTKIQLGGRKEGSDIDTVFNNIIDYGHTVDTELKETIVSTSRAYQHHSRKQPVFRNTNLFNHILERPHQLMSHDKENTVTQSSPSDSHEHTESLIMDHTRQVQLINMLYLKYETILMGKAAGSISHDTVDYILSSIQENIKTKLQGYKQQDIKKFCNPPPSSSIKKLPKEYISENIISAHDAVELLVSNRLKCSYCKESCYVIYKSQYDKKQWSLDRIDNSVGHSVGNLVISCLECNIKRGTMNKERFEKGKNIRIVRKLQF